MRAIGRFVKATLVGGFLFVVPLVVVALVVREAVRLTGEALRPVAQLVPAEKVAGVVVMDLIAVAAVVVLCFVAGLFVGTRVGRAFSSRLERLVLRRVPGFTLVQSVTRGLAGLEKESGLQAALARLEDAWVLAFVVERHGNGLCTVFVPSAPTPAAGSIYFLTEDRVRPLDVPVLAAVQCIMQLGVGSRELLKNASLAEALPGAGIAHEGTAPVGDRDPLCLLPSSPPSAAEVGGE